MQQSIDAPETGATPPRPPPTPGQSIGVLLLITLLSLPAWQPLLHGRLTCGFDNVFHLWRSVQIGSLLENGILFSRWAPHMAHGYGYPLYLYQAPFSAYLVALFQTSGVSWTSALNVVYGLGIIASGWTMWLLARDLWGYRGAMVAAVAYIFAPFHAYIAFYRASLSETVAWVFVPLLLWGLLRWQGERKQRRGLLTAVIAFILLMFTHDVTAYAFFPLLAGWVMVPAFSQKSWGALGRGLVALFLGLGGSAFFWLPAIGERTLIQFERANSAWPFLYFNNFLPLDQLLAWPRNADPLLLNDWPERGLGVLLTSLAVVGAILAWQRLPRARWLIGYLGLMLAGYLFLTVAVSRPLWDTVTLLQVFQFPWRFLAPATLAAALLSGGTVFLFQPQKGQTGQRFISIALPLALIALLSLAHWGWFFPQLCQAPADTSLAGLVAWEKATGTVGTTASRELLPTPVNSLPKEAGNLPVWEARLAETDLPEGAHILKAVYEPLRAEIELETAVPFTARFRAFAFPGWRVLVNGEPVAITPSEPEGLLTFPVPAGQHNIRVTFGETPFRIFADIISFVSLAALGLIMIRFQSKSKPGAIPFVSEQRRFWAFGFLLALLLLGVKVFAADAGRLPVHTTYLKKGEVINVTNPSQLTFGTPGNPALVRLLGTGDLPTAVAADAALPLTLHWQALTSLHEDYRVGLTVISEDNLRWSERGLRDYRWTRDAPPTSGWPTDKYVQTAFFVDLLSGTPPGTYSLQLSLFNEETLTPLTVYDDGIPLGPAIELGEVTIDLPQQPWPASAFNPQYPINLPAATLQIEGVSLDREQAAPGEAVLVTIFWRNAAEVPQNGTLVLQDETGAAVAEWQLAFPAFGAGYFRQQRQLRLPASLADGNYTWHLVPDDATSATFGRLAIIAPERIFNQPEVTTAVAETLYKNGAPVATLVGYRLNSEACRQKPGQCTVTLIWQALAENNVSYRVFVQLLDEEGNVRAQHDGMPAEWRRPTTGWLPGEFVSDAHVLNIESWPSLSNGQVIVGLYSPDGARLATEDGREFIVLPLPD